MTRPAFVTYEPTVIEAPAFRVQALFGPANDEFDDALEQVASTLRTKRGKPQRQRLADGDDMPEGRSPSLASTLVATGAIAAAGYRFVLRPPDDAKLRPWWYARFPSV